MKKEEGYYCNLTIFEWFVRPRRSLGETVGAAEIFGFQPASGFFALLSR
ncbi:MAG: hypothetical protein WCJ25_05265 [Candidatus Moraniibacteriota bacterium]